MLQYTETSSSLPWIIVPVFLLPAAYWWFEMKPAFIRLSCAGKAHFKMDHLNLQHVFVPVNPEMSKELLSDNKSGFVVTQRSIHFKEVCNFSPS